MPRLAPAPIEVRGCLASYDPEDDLVTVWASAQDPWRQAAQLATVLRREPKAVRVVVPHVGGAFGSKGSLAPEYGLAAWCAIHHGAPVRWFEDRGENLLASYQGRGMQADLELALDAEEGSSRCGQILPRTSAPTFIRTPPMSRRPRRRS